MLRRLALVATTALVAFALFPTVGESKPKKTKPSSGTAQLLTLVDGDGNDLSPSAKTGNGILVCENVDDRDSDGGAGGNAQNVIVSDKDDPNGVTSSKALQPFRLARGKSAPAGARFRLTYGSSLVVWKTSTKQPGSKLASGAAFDAADTTLYVEGYKASAPGTPETLAVALEDASGKVLSKDQGNVWVARTAALLAGHGNSGTSVLTSMLSKRREDKRSNPTLVRGKDAKTGKALAWAVFIWSDEKHAKIALSTEGSCVAYDGHSNFGLGYAFETDFKKISQFMNIADAQVPVNLEYLRDHQDHPDLTVEDSEYGDDASTPEFSDPAQVPANVEGAHGNYATARFPLYPPKGAPHAHLVRGPHRWQDAHFGQTGNLRIVVKAGARDMPAKKWDRLFLNSCYSGTYYYDSFGGRGTLFFTTDEASSSRTSALFIMATVDGLSNDATLAKVNADENINDYHVFK